MKKALFLFSIFTLIIGCQQENPPQNHRDHQANHVAVIIDDLLWNGEIGDTLRQRLASPVLGLTQEEPLFTLDQYPQKILEGYMSHSRNIVVVKRGPKKNFEIKLDQYTIPQTVVYISGRNTDELIDVIQANSAKMISQIRNREIYCMQENFKKSALNVNRIRDKFGISIVVPTEFKYVKEADNFIWLKKDITSGNTNIAIYQVPLNFVMPKSDVVNNVVRIRDSVAALYIHGAAEGTVMITEKSYSPYLFKTKIDGKRAFEIRGTWELDRNMAGPFVNYTVIDSVNNRALIIEGFCHIPAKHKRDLMIELEAIIKSTKFNSK